MFLRRVRWSHGRFGWRGSDRICNFLVHGRSIRLLLEICDPRFKAVHPRVKLRNGKRRRSRRRDCSAFRRLLCFPGGASEDIQPARDDNGERVSHQPRRRRGDDNNVTRAITILWLRTLKAGVSSRPTRQNYPFKKTVQAPGYDANRDANR